MRFGIHRSLMKNKDLVSEERKCELRGRCSLYVKQRGRCPGCCCASQGFLTQMSCCCCSAVETERPRLTHFHVCHPGVSLSSTFTSNLVSFASLKKQILFQQFHLQHKVLKVQQKERSLSKMGFKSH